MKTDVAIIGGGPGGSATAMFLSQTGLRVTLIEKAQSPRYHIGESLTGECGNCLRALGLEEEMTGRRHPVKYGVTVYGPGGKNAFWVPVKGWHPESGLFDSHTWSVRRSDFDHMLFTAAAARGVSVMQAEAIAPLLNGEAVRGAKVVGGGAGGVEVLLAIQHRLQKLGATIKYILLTDSDRILPGHNRRVQRLFERILVERNIEVHLLTKVVDVNDVCITLESGQRIVADTVVYATGPTPWPWMHASGLAVDPAGFLMIDSNLQSISATAVFAAGDCAVMHPRDYPKSGVYAVRQGSPLARNLRSTLTNNSLSPYRPQARALALISTGDKRAVLSYGPLALEGAWVWRWKDGIDRTFVRRYRMSL